MHVAIWVSAFLFSAIHLQFFGFVPRLLLGVLFGYIYYWSGNLLYPVLAHFINNGFTLVMLYLYQIGITEMDIENTESVPVMVVLVSVILTFGLLAFFRRYHFLRARIDNE